MFKMKNQIDEAGMEVSVPKAAKIKALKNTILKALHQENDAQVKLYRSSAQPAKND
jgi:hypothetical protein